MTEHLRKLVGAMLHSHVDNYVSPGLTSSLVGGGEFGCVRLLTADRDSREWVTPHSHRFDFVALVLRGSVENIVFHDRPQPSDELATNYYAKGIQKPIEGGLGRYEIDRTGEIRLWSEHPTLYVEGDTYGMKAEEIHSIRFRRDSVVLFFEGPNVHPFSVFLEPASDGHVIHTFETRPWMFHRRTTT